MKNIKLALLNIKKNFDNAKELKSSFITTIIGMCINNIAFLILWYNFGKLMGNLNGWEAYDVFGLYGFSCASYGIVNAFFYGIFNLPTSIATGNFDKYLATPKNTLLKVSTSSISTSAIGDLIYGIICFIIYCFIIKISLVKLLLSIFMMILITVIYFAFALICMSISFYFMDGEDVSHGFHNMFLSVSLYQGGAFTGVLRFIFIYIMPSLLVGALPVEILKTMSINGILLIVLATIFWLTFSIWFFYKSLKKYESSNFFGFGN